MNSPYLTTRDDSYENCRTSQLPHSCIKESSGYKDITMLLVKMDEQEFLAFITPDGNLELRDAKFNPFSFQSDGEVVMRDSESKQWLVTNVADFKCMVKDHMNYCLNGLTQLSA